MNCDQWFLIVTEVTAIVRLAYDIYSLNDAQYVGITKSMYVSKYITAHYTIACCQYTYAVTWATYIYHSNLPFTPIKLLYMNMIGRKVVTEISEAAQFFRIFLMLLA